ncbi:MAG: zinc ribbon domain-containing protein [Eubacterium sp.]|nr:zinc ribbon domain-containing protein [Eubacterium sp.]
MNIDGFIKCPSCGNYIKNGARYCRSCGSETSKDVGRSGPLSIVGKVTAIVAGITSLILAIHSGYIWAIIVSIVAFLFSIIRMIISMASGKKPGAMVMMLLIIFCIVLPMSYTGYAYADATDEENGDDIPDDLKYGETGDYYLYGVRYESEQESLYKDDLEVLRERFAPLQKYKTPLNDREHYDYGIFKKYVLYTENAARFRYLVVVYNHEDMGGEEAYYILDVNLTNLSVPIHASFDPSEGYLSAKEYYGPDDIPMMNYGLTEIDNSVDEHVSMDSVLAELNNKNVPMESTTFFGQDARYWEIHETYSGKNELSEINYCVEMPLEDFDQSLYFTFRLFGLDVGDDNKEYEKAQPEIESVRNATYSVSEPVLFYVRVPKGTAISVDEDASKESGESETEIDDSVFDDKKKVTDKSDKTENSEKNPGSAAAAVIVAGVGVAAEELTRKKKKTGRKYLRIYKDFGDSIKRGASPYYVYAHIVEVLDDGTEVERTDYSSQIRIYSGSQALLVKEQGMAGTYKSASIMVPNENETTRDVVVVFQFTGAGGSFTERLHFNVVGDPLIAFPDQGTSMYMVCEGLLGDNSTYEVRFSAKYFTQRPVRVKAESGRNDIELSVQQLTDTDNYEYKVLIQNKTAAPIPGEGEVQRISVNVSAESPVEKADDTFLLELYPEGISVKGAVDASVVQKGRVRLNTKENESRGAMDPMIKPVSVKFITAYKNEQGEVVIDEKSAIADLTLSGYDDFSTSAIERYDYDIEKGNEESVYNIKPQRTIPIDPRSGYNLYWNATSSTSGNRYDAQIPVDIIGEELDRTAVQSRQEELQKLSRLAQVMLLYDIPECAQLISIAKNKQAASEIKQIRSQIFSIAVDYHTKEAAASQSYAKWMSAATYTCMFVDWAGQQAFSYVIKVSYGDVAEMILSPLKNLLVEQTAEYLNAKYWDYEFQVDIYSKLIECFENMAENFLVDALFGDISADDITEAGKKLWKNVTTDLGKLNLSDIKGSLMKAFGATTIGDRAKKAAAFVASFAALNFTKHYCLDDETKDDFGKSIVATLNDCTLTTIKQIFNKYAGKWIGNWMDKKTDSGATRGDVLKSFVGKYFKIQDVKARGILCENREAEIFGKKYGFGVQSNSLDTATTQFLEDSYDKLVDNTIGIVSSWFWDSEFGGFIINTTSGVYKLTLGNLIDFIFEWISSNMDIEGPMLKNRVKVPDYIPPADEESLNKAKAL